MVDNIENMGTCCAAPPDGWVDFLNIIIFLLAILGIVGLILSLPFIIYGVIKHKKNFIILGIIGLLILPITLVLFALASSYI